MTARDAIVLRAQIVAALTPLVPFFVLAGVIERVRRIFGRG